MRSCLYLTFPLLMLLTTVTSPVTCQSQRPNIILMLADDLGWADVHRHDSSMPTPTLDWLETRGMMLNYSYVLPTCAPTRSAILTGRYPYTYGMQVNDITGARRAWLDETLTLLPATLKTLGYATHMIGKWHLGFCDWSLTPTRRGFDTFYGFYTGAQGYFNHSGKSSSAYDFRDNDEVVWSARGHYSTELHTTRAQRIIRERDSQTPFFLYMSYQNVHGPFEAKQRYVDDYCSHVENRTRRIHCAMVAAMDESIKNITDTLREEGQLDNTILVFLSDNGGPTEDGSFNYPLRGKKATLWEGGTRVFTLLAYPGLARRDGYVYPGLIHAIDWYPTLVQAAGGEPPSGLDGIGMWRELLENQDSPRNEFVYNIDDKNRRSAIRWGDWKLAKGRPGRKYNGWYPPPSLQEQGARWEEVRKRRVPKWHLYNIATDPTERQNLYRSSNRSHRRIAREMKRKLQVYRRRLEPYRQAPKVAAGNPRRTGGVYSPGWCNP